VSATPAATRTGRVDPAAADGPGGADSPAGREVPCGPGGSGGSGDHVDPRVRRSREAVLAATAELLTEVGVHGVTIEAVALRSGVAKTTIYRHWPERSQLVLDAIDRVAEPCRAPDTGTLRGDLTAILDGLVEALTTSVLGQVMPSLIDAAERDAEVARLQATWVRARRGAVHQALARAEARGEIPAGLDDDLVGSIFGGAAFYRRLVSHEPLDARFRAGLVDAVLRVAGPPPTP
jgi:AcrR family transcriptional regulator